MKAMKQKVEKEKFLVEISPEEKEDLLLCMYASSLPSLRIKKYKECDTDSFSEPYSIKDIDLIMAKERINPSVPTYYVRRAGLPHEVSVFFRRKMDKKSKLPTGVSYDKTHRVFSVTCSIDGIRKKIGTSHDPNIAFVMYKEVKEAEAKRVAQLYYDRGEISKDIYDELMRWEVKR